MRSFSGIGQSTCVLCLRRAFRMDSDGRLGRGQVSSFESTAAVPAACPICIIVRDNRQLEAEIELNPVP